MEAALNLSLVAAYLVTVVVALTLGGRAERLGGLILALGLLATWGAQAFVAEAPLVFGAIDFVGAAAFGVLAIRNPDKLWPGLASCAQLLVCVFSITRAMDFPLSQTAYTVMLNVSGVGILASLSGGTWASRWLRRAPDEWDVAARQLEA